MTRARVAWLVPVLVLGVGACGLDGDDPAAWGMVRFVQRDGEFSIDVLSPPWAILESKGGLRMRIAPEVFGFDVDIAASTHGLEIARVAAGDDVAQLQGVEGFVPEDERFDPLAGLEIPTRGEPVAPLADVDLQDPFAVARAEITYLAIRQGAQVDFDLAPWTNAAQQQGMSFQLVTQRDTFMRVVYLPSERGVVRAAVVSVFDTATTDIAWMLDGFVTDVPRPPQEDEPAGSGMGVDTGTGADTGSTG